VLKPSRGTLTLEAGLENFDASVAIVAAAGLETRAPQASAAADVRRLKSFCYQTSTLNLQLFVNQRGGLGKAHQLFGDGLNKLLDELNETLAA
jgi:hypothetical protein